jgi:Outer membrane protein/protective antigen OMA87
LYKKVPLTSFFQLILSRNYIVSKNILTFGALNVFQVMIKRITLSISLALLISGYLHATDICISGIRISGNNKTKDFTILRELPFRIGDVLPEDKLIFQLQVATEHLNNISLFNYVNVDYIPDTIDQTQCLSCIITVEVEERWYYVPQVSLKIEDRNLSNWIHEKNYNRITVGWGMRVYNVFGLRHKITVSNYLGYENGLRLAYSNIALDKKRTHLLGFVTTALFNKTLNLYSENNKAIYLKDPDNYIDKTFGGAISYSYRPEIRTVHSFEVGYQRTQLNSSVLLANNEYWGTDNTKNNIFNASYTYSHEHRDYAVYPTKGYYVSSTLSGVAADNMNFFYGELNTKLQYYDEVFNRWFWSSRINAGTTIKNKRAQIYDRHVGYDDKNITGYDYYVIDGQHYSILNNDLRFLVMPKRIFNLSSSKKAPKFSKIHFSLYAKLSYDIGYVHNSYKNASNTLANSFLWGSGVGLDLVTYYDIVINASYAINKMGKGGFYFGLKAPIF